MAVSTTENMETAVCLELNTWTEGLTTGHTGLGRQPFSEYPHADCVLRGCQRLACSLREGLGAGPALRAGKEAGSCSVVPEEKLLSDGMLVEAREASEEDLLVVHTRRYLNELKVRNRPLWVVAGSSGWRRKSPRRSYSCP